MGEPRQLLRQISVLTDELGAARRREQEAAQSSELAAARQQKAERLAQSLGTRLEVYTTAAEARDRAEAEGLKIRDHAQDMGVELSELRKLLRVCNERFAGIDRERDTLRQQEDELAQRQAAFDQARADAAAAVSADRERTKEAIAKMAQVHAKELESLQELAAAREVLEEDRHRAEAESRERELKTRFEHEIAAMESHAYDMGLRRNDLGTPLC